MTSWSFIYHFKLTNQLQCMRHQITYPKKMSSSSPPPSVSSLSSYFGLSFSLFLASLPNHSLTHLASLASRNRILSIKLFDAEDQLKILRSRRKEDSKANARVVEIFASHRNTWQQEEKRLLVKVEEKERELVRLRGRVAELEKEVRERDEMLDFMSRKDGFENYADEDDYKEAGFESSEIGIAEDMADGCFTSLDSKQYFENLSHGLQDTKYASLESMYHMKHFAARRESPWKVEGDSTVSSKLQVLEEELINLEKVGKGDISKISILMRKQAKRYQSLTGKIDDLCRRMQASDPCGLPPNTDMRTQQQTEFLHEADRLQQRATETRQKLGSLQSETIKCNTGDDLSGQAKLNTRRSLETIGNNFREIQRNLEIWLARIIGDIEGVLAREKDSSSCIRDYYLPPYPFVTR